MPPQVSADQLAANELIKRIRKLRWIGMDREAKALQGTLDHAASADSVLAVPYETD
jgi:hypothetical protein